MTISAADCELAAFEQDQQPGDRSIPGQPLRERACQDDADILVGADGIHSTVRRQLYPTEGEPRFAQQVLWRAAIDSEPFLGGRTMIIAGHFHQRIIVYPVGRGAKPGQLLTNWICQMSVPGDSAAARGLEPARVERAGVGGIRRVAVSLARHACADRADT